MPVKERKPTSPGTRFQILDTYDDITKNEPEKSLIVPLKNHAGRDSTGRISARHRGGGNKRMYRIIDFKRDKDNIPATVEAIEYDPNRNVRIALITFDDGEKRYILAPLGIKIGQKVVSGEDVEISLGNCLPLKNIPLGSVVHNIEMNQGKGGVLVRSAGGAAMILGKEKGYAIIRLPSSEQRMIHLNCRATIGQLGNTDAMNKRKGKAGKSRYCGIRPAVRGTAMNPCDHPHGGGEGKAGVGRKYPVSPAGKHALGKLTRNPRKNSWKFIIRRRKG
jgi:large subunit ribosomal protein L2